MKKRTTQPKNNKYYIRQVSGGLNGAVAGKPTISGANVLCNCVGYANGRFNEAANDPDLKGITKAFRWQLVCNAENFIESAKKQGLSISSTPVLGGIMVWQKGSTLGGGDGAGHVAFVEAVYTDGTILTSESGWNAWAFRTVKRSNANGRWSQAAGYKFRGCIINPAIKSEKTPATKDDGKLAVDGIGGPATVKAMQRFFGTTQDGVISGQLKTQAKYYPALKSVKYGSGGSPCIKNLQRWTGVTQDGILGPTTVKAWQKKIGVTADGIFGTNSMKTWQKYLNEHDKAVYPAQTIIDQELDACRVQADWMKNFIYKWIEGPTIANTKKYGTCVSYVAVVLQRIAILKSGQYIWINSKGKVEGANSKMTVSHPGGTLKSNKSKLKKGDIIIGGNGKTGAGQGSHIFILTGKWSGDNPYIYDQDSASRVKKGKVPEHTWKGSFKMIALIRLKEQAPDASVKTNADKILDACKTQAEYMKNAKYGDYSPVTLKHSKEAGTCVTYEGCVFQRLGALASGKFVWQNGKGYGTGKVTGVNKDTMTVTYMDNKTIASLKSKIKKGDCILLDDNKSGKKGSGGHVFFATGEWSGTDPYIWDFESSRTCAKTGKPRKYNGNRKVLAIVRLK